MSRLYVPCPACKLLNFHVRYDDITGVAQVECAHCQRTMLEGEMRVASGPDPDAVRM